MSRQPYPAIPYVPACIAGEVRTAFDTRVKQADPIPAAPASPHALGPNAGLQPPAVAPTPGRRAVTTLSQTPAPYTAPAAAIPPAPAGDSHPLAALPTNDNGQFVNAWHQGLSPERRQAFESLASQANMPHADLARALAAEGAMRQRFSGIDPRQGDAPNYSDVAAFHRQLPVEYQNALADFQAYQMDQAGSGYGQTRTPGTQSGILDRGEARPQSWVLRARANAPGADDPNRLLDPQHYENMHEFAGLHGVDTTRPEFRRYWQQQQQSWANPETRHAGGVPGLIESYRGQQAQQQNRQEGADARGDTQNAQRFLGMRRTDPATGQEYVTANPQGRGSMGFGDHIAGIGRTLASGAIAPGAVGADIAGSFNGEGAPETAYSQMAGRSFLDYANRLMGTDIGHNVESRPRAFRPGGEYANQDIGPDAGRGFFGTNNVVTPSTYRRDADTVGPSRGVVPQRGVADAYGQAWEAEANRPGAGLGSRTLHHTLSRMAHGAEPAIAAMTGGRMLGGSTGATIGGVGSQMVNPMWSAGVEPLRAIPTGDRTVGDHLDDYAARSRLDAMAPDANWGQRLWGNTQAHAAGLLSGAPGMVAGDAGRAIPGRGTPTTFASRFGRNLRGTGVGAAALPVLGGLAETGMPWSPAQPVSQDQRDYVQSTIGQTAEQRRLHAWRSHLLEQQRSRYLQTGRIDPQIQAQLDQRAAGPQ